MTIFTNQSNYFWGGAVQLICTHPEEPINQSTGKIRIEIGTCRAVQEACPFRCVQLRAALQVLAGICWKGKENEYITILILSFVILFKLASSSWEPLSASNINSWITSILEELNRIREDQRQLLGRADFYWLNEGKGEEWRPWEALCRDAVKCTILRLLKR